MKAKPRFKDKRLSHLIYDETQSPKARTNTSGINVSWSVCRETVDEENDTKKALKGKEMIEE